MMGSRQRRDSCPAGARRSERAGDPLPRLFLRFGGRARRIARLAALSFALATSTAVPAQGIASLSAYLRLNGTQLDLRGTDATDADLAFLGDPAFSQVSSVLLARTRVGDRGLERLRTLRVRQLDLYLTAVTDAGMEHLRGLPVERLDLTGTAVGDTGLVRLGGLPLRTLVLRETKVTDAGLGALRDMPLRYLDLSYTAISDAGLARLEGLRELGTIDLSDTAVGDAGLRELARSPRLVTIYVAGTKITPAGLADFRSARPEVRLHSDRSVR